MTLISTQVSSVLLFSPSASGMNRQFKGLPRRSRIVLPIQTEGDHINKSATSPGVGLLHGGSASQQKRTIIGHGLFVNAPVEWGRRSRRGGNAAPSPRISGRWVAMRPEDSLRKRAEEFFSELEARFECDPPDRRMDSRTEETQKEK